MNPRNEDNTSFDSGNALDRILEQSTSKPKKKPKVIWLKISLHFVLLNIITLEYENSKHDQVVPFRVYHTRSRSILVKGFVTFEPLDASSWVSRDKHWLSNLQDLDVEDMSSNSDKADSNS